MLPKSIEAGDNDVVKMTLCQRVKFNFFAIKNAMKIPEMWKAILFFSIAGCIIPNYSDYLYYY